MEGLHSIVQLEVWVCKLGEIMEVLVEGHVLCNWVANRCVSLVRGGQGDEHEINITHNRPPILAVAEPSEYHRVLCNLAICEFRMLMAILVSYSSSSLPMPKSL